MGTSSSKGPGAEPSGRWTGRASVFSGRPEPRWEVPADVAHRLIAMWDRMPAAPEGGAEPAGLGYRYCSLSSPDGIRWVAYRGLVKRESPEGVEVRRDAGGQFESGLLASAPEGLLPRRD